MENLKKLLVKDDKVLGIPVSRLLTKDGQPTLDIGAVFKNFNKDECFLTGSTADLIVGAVDSPQNPLFSNMWKLHKSIAATMFPSLVSAEFSPYLAPIVRFWLPYSTQYSDALIQKNIELIQSVQFNPSQEEDTFLALVEHYIRLCEANVKGIKSLSLLVEFDKLGVTQVTLNEQDMLSIVMTILGSSANNSTNSRLVL